MFLSLYGGLCFVCFLIEKQMECWQLVVDDTGIDYMKEKKKPAFKDII